MAFTAAEVVSKLAAVAAKVVGAVVSTSTKVAAEVAAVAARSWSLSYSHQPRSQPSRRLFATEGATAALLTMSMS